MINKTLTVLALAAALAGCSNMQRPGAQSSQASPSGSSTSMGASAADIKQERWCRVFHSYNDRPLSNVMEECQRQMSAEQCQRCLQ